MLVSLHCGGIPFILPKVNLPIPIAHDLIHCDFVYQTRSLNKVEVKITYQIPLKSHAASVNNPQIQQTHRILDELDACPFLHKYLEELIGHSPYYSMHRDYYRLEMN